MPVRVSLARRRRVRGQLMDRGVRLGRLTKEILDVARSVGDGVRDEGQRRRELDAGLAPHLGAEDSACGLQGGRRRLTRLLVTEDGVEDGRLTEVRRDPDIRDGDEAQPGILDFHLQRLRHDDFDPISQLALASLACHRQAFLGFSRISNVSITSSTLMSW